LLHGQDSASIKIVLWIIFGYICALLFSNVLRKGFHCYSAVLQEQDGSINTSKSDYTRKYSSSYEIVINIAIPGIVFLKENKYSLSISQTLPLGEKGLKVYM